MCVCVLCFLFLSEVGELIIASSQDSLFLRLDHGYTGFVSQELVLRR